MIEFNFFCPACMKGASAKADPIGLLFGAEQLRVECASCGTAFLADIVQGARGTGIEVKEIVMSPEDTDATDQ